MRRWSFLCFCAVCGVVLLVVGLLVPVHMRAVDSSVIKQAGKETTTVVEEGVSLVKEGKHGAAQMLFQTAKMENIPGSEKLEQAIAWLVSQHRNVAFFGAVEPGLETIFDKTVTNAVSIPFADFLIRFENREKVLNLMQDSSHPLVRELLLSRGQTNTIFFPPALSSSGQAFDAAVCVCGLLAASGHMSKELATTLFQSALEANYARKTERLELVLMDLLSLAHHLNWNQLETFTSTIKDPETLRLLASQVRKAKEQLPILFSAVVISEKPDAVSKYVALYSKSGLQDLGTSMSFGQGSLLELLRRNQRLVHSEFVAQTSQAPFFGGYFKFLFECCWQLPMMALAAKWIFIVLAGFLMSEVLFHFKPLQKLPGAAVSGKDYHFVCGFLFALGFLLVVLMLSEPFLAQGGQKVESTFRLRLPVQSGLASAGTSGARALTTIMNKPSLDLESLMILLLFFVLQALLYTACLRKLSEIRRQNVEPQLKLKLLENEDHLFDAGLYLGFVGTIISLIVASLGVAKLSLMAAYSSTSFGIIFVSIFKIFHLRLLRRNLLLEIEGSRNRPSASDVKPS